MKAPYALVPVVILVLLVYSASFLASRFSIIKPGTHRKFWNSLLLLTFFTTACLGLILAIQVCYPAWIFRNHYTGYSPPGIHVHLLRE